MVVKKDGRRVPRDKAKIVRGLERACFKRPVPEAELIRVADEVEEDVSPSTTARCYRSSSGNW